MRLLGNESKCWSETDSYERSRMRAQRKTSFHLARLFKVDLATSFSHDSSCIASHSRVLGLGPASARSPGTKHQTWGIRPIKYAYLTHFCTHCLLPHSSSRGLSSQLIHVVRQSRNCQVLPVACRLVSGNLGNTQTYQVTRSLFLCELMPGQHAPLDLLPP